MTITWLGGALYDNFPFVNIIQWDSKSLGRLAVPTQVRVDESRHDSTLMLSVDNKLLESKEKPSPEFDKVSPLPDTSVASGSLFGSLAALDKVFVCPPNLRNIHD